jgi:putative ABC transport system permease protein
VKAATYGQDTLLMGAFYGTAQLQMSDGSFRPVAGNFVPADYLDASGMTMVKGRWLSGKRGQDEVVIGQELAKERFGDKDPIGQFIKIQIAMETPMQVVGVVRDVRETIRASAGMRFYSPAWEYPPNIHTLILRMDKDPAPAFAGTVRRAIYQIDPRLIISDVASIGENVERAMGQENLAFKVMKGLAVIALGLTIVGLFSVIAYAVSSRMTEFGIRMAVGATPANIRSLIMGRGLFFAALGVVIGVSGGIALTRFMQGMLFETSPFDPAVYCGVALLLLASAAAACALPARRAARADVIRLLKSE